MVFRSQIGDERMVVASPYGGVPHGDRADPFGHEHVVQRDHGESAECWPCAMKHGGECPKAGPLAQLPECLIPGYGIQVADKDRGRPGLYHVPSQEHQLFVPSLEIPVAGG